MSAPLDLVRADLRGFAGYASARREASVGEVWLNANESPWPADGDGLALNRYPEPQPPALLERLAALYGVVPERLLVGRGSDEAIDLLVRALCVPAQDAVLIASPTFGMYAVAARLHGARVLDVPLDAAFAPDIAAMSAALDDSVKLVFVCSPNNPTGNAVPRTTIEALARATDGRAVLVIDEAYAEFCDGDSALPLLDRFPSLAVLRTLSKAHGLAGARIGTLVGDPSLIGVLRTIMAPYPLPTPSVQAALAALQPAALALARSRIAQIGEERARLAQRLAGLRRVREVYRSDANFVLVRFDDGARCCRSLAERGIVVRDVGRHPALRDCLRITVGSPQENDRLLAALAAIGPAADEDAATIRGAA